MKRVLSVLVLAFAAACSAPPAPNTAEQWAAALCARDAQTLSNLSGGVIAGTTEEIEETLAFFPFECTGVRALGVVHGQYGDEYFFALDMGDYEVWYGLTVEDGLVVDVE